MAPKYTIILPLRNGGDYLKSCVSSILAQSYEDFELAVLENASTDDSVAWLNSLHEKRIKIYPAERPLSIEENWGRARQIPRGEFMTFIGHDDLLEPSFLQVIDGLTTHFPQASLYQTHFQFIDDVGNRINSCTPVPERESGLDLLRGYFTNQRQSYSGFVMRSAQFDEVGGFPNFERLLWADYTLWDKIGASLMEGRGATGMLQAARSSSLDRRLLGLALHLNLITLLYVVRFGTRKKRPGGRSNPSGTRTSIFPESLPVGLFTGTG